MKTKTGRGQEGETERSTTTSPVEQSPHILKYLPGCQDNIFPDPVL